MNTNNFYLKEKITNYHNLFTYTDFKWAMLIKSSTLWWVINVKINKYRIWNKNSEEELK